MSKYRKVVGFIDGGYIYYHIEKRRWYGWEGLFRKLTSITDLGDEVWTTKGFIADEADRIIKELEENAN